MSTLNPLEMADWEIAQSAETRMKTIQELGEELGLRTEEVLPYGHYMGKLDTNLILDRLKDRPNGKYIDITAITPTPLGEGKSTTTIGLLQGLGYISKKASAAIRQPSGGPTFNIKGSAAGGGLSQCIPLADFSLGLTGDIDAITKAHNLAMVALTSRMQHEFNYGDKTLEKKNLKRLNINPKNISIGWAIDFCAQSLRNIIIGQGGKLDGFMMHSGFQISVSSELMAILAIAKDLKDMRERIGKMIVAYDKRGNPITTSDLEVAGAMAAIMAKAIMPSLLQTIEGQPVLVHAGPFANIAIGQSSIVADYIGLKLSDYHLTESGFGADIGFEKFCSLKCRFSELKPDCAVIVATVRALKMHGGGPKVVPGKKLAEAYTQRNIALLENGISNLIAHIETVQKAGVPAVVCINHFYTDHDDEIQFIREKIEAIGARVAVSKHWLEGGEGAKELAEMVVKACEEPNQFKYFYNDEDSIKEKIEALATKVYGADGVDYSAEANKKIAALEADDRFKHLNVCMVKTHLSLSDDPYLKGRPKGWKLSVQDILVYQGAEFIVPMAGTIKLMPGTASDPNYRRIDIDTDTGVVTGLF
ncbi:MAG: formate--tetrahydrofolate ligase [Saprospiraceae bacterium]|nr:formate--tetrahydrofolate ligase [Saprospiraceae bacterium]